MHFAILHQKVILNKSNFRFKYLKFVKKNYFLKILTFFLSLMSMAPISVSINAVPSKNLYQGEYLYGDKGDTVLY